MDFEKFIVKEVPSSCYYIPNFITEAEESLLVHQIERTPLVKWTQLKDRRLINFGGIPHDKGMVAEHIPENLQNYVDKINQLGIFGDKAANHILLNQYNQGEGIMPHLDGPLFHPVISTLSLGSHTVLRFHETPAEEEDRYSNFIEPVFKLVVEQRSLLVLKDDLYNKYMHSIESCYKDKMSDPLIRNLSYSSFTPDQKKVPRSTRFSLTIRHVPKTSKLKLKFGK